MTFLFQFPNVKRKQILFNDVLKEKIITYYTIVKMKKVIYSLVFTLIFSVFIKTANAQTYTWAAGLKFGGYENGISAKYFGAPQVALEGILGFRNQGVVITGLYEIYMTPFPVEELKFYFGGGAHIGAEGSGIYQTFGGRNEIYKNQTVLLGLDGVVGLEYQIPQAPIAVSLDLNPRIEVATGPFLDIAPGLGVKYTF